VGPRAGLDAVAKQIPSMSVPGIEPRRPAHSPVSMLTVTHM